MNGSTLALGIVGALAAAGALSRRGSRSSSWGVEDTDALVRAVDAMRPAAGRWARAASSQSKRGVLEAYESLPLDERNAMQEAIRLSWMEEGFSGRRPLFRTPAKHQQRGAGGAGGLSLSRRPNSGWAYTEPDERTRVFLVLPEEVALDSRVPNVSERSWYSRFEAWDPPSYDKSGRPTNRRSGMSAGALRLFGHSPLWTPEYGDEDEVILRSDAKPPELSYAEYLLLRGKS